MFVSSIFTTICSAIEIDKEPQIRQSNIAYRFFLWQSNTLWSGAKSGLTIWQKIPEIFAAAAKNICLNNKRYLEVMMKGPYGH